MRAQVKEDPADIGVWMVIVDGQPTTPRFVNRGAAEICADMYMTGRRKPEFGPQQFAVFRNKFTRKTKSVDEGNAGYYRSSPFWEEIGQLTISD